MKPPPLDAGLGWRSLQTAVERRFPEDLTKDCTLVHFFRGRVRPENGIMPRKIRDLIRDLEEAGFQERRGKGSHRNFRHPLVAKAVTIAGKDGDDAKRYLEKAVSLAINEVKQWGKATDT